MNGIECTDDMRRLLLRTLEECQKICGTEDLYDLLERYNHTGLQVPREDIRAFVYEINRRVYGLPHAMMTREDDGIVVLQCASCDSFEIQYVEDELVSREVAEIDEVGQVIKLDDWGESVPNQHGVGMRFRCMDCGADYRPPYGYVVDTSPHEEGQS